MSSAQPFPWDVPATSQFFAALNFAASHHRDQKRKDAEGTPYINHPIQVMTTLWDVGQIRDLDVLIAALLHDTVEDTDATIEDIHTTFGTRVAGFVAEVTDDKSLPKQERKRLQIDMAPQKSSAAKAIKLADKSCNIHDIGLSPPPPWPHQRRLAYLDWAATVVDALRGEHPLLEAHFDIQLNTARQRLAQVETHSERDNTDK